MDRIDYVRKSVVKNFAWYLVLALTFLLVASLSSVEFVKFDKVIKHNANIVLFLLLFSLIPSKLFSRSINAVIVFLLSLFTLVEIGHIFIFSTRPTLNVFFTIFETQSGEVQEFFTTYFVSWSGLFLLLLPLCWFILGKILGRLCLKVRFLDLILILSAIINGIYLSRKGLLPQLEKVIDSTPFYAINAGRQYYAEIQKFQRMKEIDPPAGYVQKTPDYLDEQTIVILIGESTSRRHMGLYGYARESTPHLSARKDQLSVLRNVISPHSHTKQSLEKVLTFLSHDLVPPEDAPSMVKLAKLAGFKTFWISNQTPLGLYDTPVTAIAKSADEKMFLNKNDDFRKSVHDSILISPFEKVLASEGKRKVIFVHLMGTHSGYDKRYPSEFAKFKGSISKLDNLNAKEIETINRYDNAVLYNDWVVDQLISKLEQAPGSNKALVYFSDHAEEVYDFRNFHGHTEAIQSNFMFEVPFIVWFSKEHQHKERLTHQLQAHADSLYSIEDFDHSFHDLAGIVSRDYLSDRSIFSKSFVAKKRIVGTKIYDPKDVPGPKYEKTRNDIVIDPKFMVHRVNSLGKLRTVSKEFNSFEVDIVYDQEKDFFDVNHPPAQSIGLSFEEYLKEDTKGNYKFWMDVKNLTEENADAVIRLLNKLDQKYKIKNRIIFESHVDLALKKIAKLGYMTSWYLPKFEGSALYEKLKYINDISPRISSDFSALSQDHNVVAFLKDHLKGINFLTWGLGSLGGKHDKEIKAMAADAQVKIMLVWKQTQFDR